MGICMICGIQDINPDDFPTFCSNECADIHYPTEKD